MQLNLILTNGTTLGFLLFTPMSIKKVKLLLRLLAFSAGETGLGTIRERFASFLSIDRG